MIEHVQTEHGLLPRAMADSLAADKAAKSQERAEAAEQLTRRRARALGLKLSEVTAMLKDPIGVLRRAASRARERWSPDKLAAAYPCRICQRVTDDNYKALCQVNGMTPCYFRNSMRGCPDLRPRAIVVGANPTAAATK